MSGAERGARVMARLDQLARHSATPGALTRLYLTPEHRAAADQVAAWMREAGLAVRIDAVGSVIGRREGDRPGLPALLLGSHIDTVRDAGKYDGALGVVAAIEAVAALGDRRMPYAIEVIAFGDEEGVRFPVTLTGSRALAGTLDPASLDACDAAGVAMRSALVAFGAPAIGAAAALGYRRDAVLGYCEVHIEQGPVLEAAGLPVGIVTAIAGAARHMVEITGVAGHAGTVPMALRHDPVCAAAEMVLAAERIARETAGLVITTGIVAAEPGAINVIAGGARLSLDIRSGDDAVRHAATAALRAEIAAIAARRGVAVAIADLYEAKAAPCAPPLVGALAESVARCGVTPRHLPSGAGHDGLAMIDLCPIAMLFVRCKLGISHNPAESIMAGDAALAVAVLTDFLTRFDPRLTEQGPSQ
ncbi:allantoate amidohydrolase [Acidiphilium sp. PA]|uniref:allantoate amidohydrolase n=1 Tax=Acidiphilium sp. PA TaxID=2871705 RepID=UPI002243B8B3|nr:allantoate amidohydrolase [Acidiphilium sp. PA]MCW8308237.1 allantoate amidohydrolase [Acidiphilium sp. PA]